MKSKLILIAALSALALPALAQTGGTGSTGQGTGSGAGSGAVNADGGTNSTGVPAPMRAITKLAPSTTSVIRLTSPPRVRI
jgi:hypothetical protein